MYYFRLKNFSFFLISASSLSKSNKSLLSQLNHLTFSYIHHQTDNNIQRNFYPEIKNTSRVSWLIKQRCCKTDKCFFGPNPVSREFFVIICSGLNFILITSLYSYWYCIDGFLPWKSFKKWRKTIDQKNFRHLLFCISGIFHTYSL